MISKKYGLKKKKKKKKKKNGRLIVFDRKNSRLTGYDHNRETTALLNSQNRFSI